MEMNEAMWKFVTARARLSTETKTLLDQTCPTCACHVAQLLEAQAEALKVAAGILTSAHIPDQ